MTTFIASLFLPHTINFGPIEPIHESPSHGANSPRDDRSVRSWTPGAGIHHHSIPKTPGATNNLETIFQPHTDYRDPHLPHLVGLSSPSEIKTPHWNQPASTAAAAPPSDVRYYKTRASDVFKPDQLAPLPRRKRRATSNEKKFTEENYTIEQACRGNYGLFHAIDAASDAGLLSDKTWVGTLGMPTDALNNHLKSTIAERIEDDHESLTVYVSDEDFEGHYEHFCKTILWPIFHYQIPDHPKSKAYQDHSWIYYVKVNQAFADRIVKNFKKGDTIWAHDYHLLLLPGMLRDKLPDAKIGFFMHTAFPSSEVFRVLATRNELCEGVLGANMVAFQTEEYGQHFLQTCSRILNVEANKDGVFLDDGRVVHVTTAGISVNPKKLDHMRALPEVADWTAQIAERYAGKRIIVARDKLDGIRGIRQKMLAFELFLNRYPQHGKDTVLIQIATVGEDSELNAAVADIVTRINSLHADLAHQPVVFLRQDIDHSQYLALLSIAECLLVTSLREGMNLTVHEYVYCQDGKHTNKQWGPLILSEFTGAASVFGNNALLINPWDHGACADTIKEALTMPPDVNRKARWHNMYDYIRNHDGTQWYLSTTQHLQHAWEEHSTRDATSVPRLSVANLVSDYRNANRRLLILDYEGTLASWGAPDDIMTSTPKRLIDTLNDLIDDPNNTVYVMSSRMPEELERLFNLVPELGLIAENGAFLREAGPCDEWLELVDLEHVSKWKTGVKEMLNYSVERIEGSRIDERHSALIYDYAHAENKTQAIKHAAECANHINEACSNQHIHAIPIENGICVSDNHLNKSSATTMIGDNLWNRPKDEGIRGPDFLLVIGDSRDDEYVFEWAQELEKTGVIQTVHTVTLGSRNTAAGATLTQGVTGVVSTLRKLTAAV